VRSIAFTCAALAVFAPAAAAETTITPTEMLVRLTVRPKAAPRPALRFLLLPELKEMAPGNPIPNYLRVVLDQDSTVEVFSPAALRLADRAARMDKPDWQILPHLKTDGINLLIPDVQKIRSLAAALQERFREENTQDRLDDSLRTAKTMFAMSRHMSEHPTLIGDLVGIAIAFVAIGPLEDMLERPGCPNLYWALTDLPHPLIPLDKGLEGERMLIEAELRGLNDRVPMTAAQIKALCNHIDRIHSFEGPKYMLTYIWLNVWRWNLLEHRPARDRLIEAGYSAEVLSKLPIEQVLLLDQKLDYEATRDDLMKLAKLPVWQGEALLAKMKPRKKWEQGLFGFLVPALNKVRWAQARLEQRIALLRHVEAIRLYAAANGGKPPAKLADCGVPLPDDPFTGKPFRYEASGDSFHLRGSPPPGQEKIPAFNIHYHVTLRK
jgi:hypothetical protein